ncbi:MAG: MBL fold metallo-hydrolase [Defluviitaleaceae bacterium]|nr:MBL fold metallo-hydrolase [Defluviitaleaceae bacterium]
MNSIAISSKIKFVGTAGIYDYELGNSAAIVALGDKKILVDCGYTVFGGLSKKGLIDEIDYLLLTHLHGDHAAGVHPAILHWTNRRKVNIKLLYPNEKYKAEMINYLKIFLGGDLDKYIDFVPVRDVEGVGFIDTLGKHVKCVQSFAYYFDCGDRLIYYSGDLGDINVTRDFLKEASHNNIAVFHEVAFIQRSEHVYYKELEALAEEYDVFAYHCNKSDAPADCKLKFVIDIAELLY